MLQKVSFKLSSREHIALGAQAEKLGITKTEFIRRALNAYMKNDEDTHEPHINSAVIEGLNRLHNTLVSLSQMLDTLNDPAQIKESFSYKMMMAGFRTIGKAIVVTNPDAGKILKTILKDKKIWTDLEELKP